MCFVNESTLNGVSIVCALEFNEVAAGEDSEGIRQLASPRLTWLEDDEALTSTETRTYTNTSTGIKWTLQ